LKIVDEVRKKGGDFVISDAIKIKFANEKEFQDKLYGLTKNQEKEKETEL